MASSACIRARLAITVSATALFMAATPVLAQTAAPQAGSGPTVVDDIIVTAQKREEAIQDVPIAVSAFSAETLDALKIEGGSELLRAVPNVTFSKNNFSMYNFRSGESGPRRSRRRRIRRSPSALTIVRCSVIVCSSRNTWMLTGLRFCVDRRAPFTGATPQPAWST